MKKDDVPSKIKHDIQAKLKLKARCLKNSFIKHIHIEKSKHEIVTLYKHNISSGSNLPVNISESSVKLHTEKNFIREYLFVHCPFIIRLLFRLVRKLKSVWDFLFERFK